YELFFDKSSRNQQLLFDYSVAKNEFYVFERRANKKLRAKFFLFKAKQGLRRELTHSAKGRFKDPYAISSARLPSSLVTTESGEQKKTLPASKPAAPQIKIPEPPQVTATTGDGMIDFSWQAQPNTEDYNLYWGNTPFTQLTQAHQIVNVEPGFQHKGLANGKTYYYRLTAKNLKGESQASNLLRLMPLIPVVETPISELLDGIYVEDFLRIRREPKLLVHFGDPSLSQQQVLRRAEALKELNFTQQQQMIALMIAEGESDSVAEALQDQLSQEPENLNLSLSLSKVLYEQGNLSAALNTLNASLGRVSLSARLALNQEIKTSAKKGKSTIKKQSEESFLAGEFYNLGSKLLERKKYKDALTAFQSLFSLSQDFPMVHYYMGQARRGLQQVSQAKDLLLTQGSFNMDEQNSLLTFNTITEVLQDKPDLESIQRVIRLYNNLKHAGVRRKLSEEHVLWQELLLGVEQRRLNGLSDLEIQLAKDFKLDEVQPGQDIYLDFLVKNKGKQKSKEFKVYYQMRHEQGFTLDLGEADRFQALQANGGSIQWNKRVIIPAQAIPGRYQVLAIVEQQGAPEELSLKNNQLASEKTLGVVPAEPDLAISFVSLPQFKLPARGKLDFKIQVKNLGFKKSTPFKLSLLATSQDGEPLLLGESKTMAPLVEKSPALQWSPSFSIPADFQQGDYQFTALIHPAREENNVKNNQTITRFDYQYERPFINLGLLPTQNQDPYSLKPSQIFSSEILLYNRGNIAMDQVVIKYYLQDNQGQLQLLGSQSIKTIKPNDKPLRLEKELPLPLQLSPGSYQVMARVTSADTPFEQATHKNQITLNQIQIQPLIRESHRERDIIALKELLIQKPRELYPYQILLNHYDQMGDQRALVEVAANSLQALPKIQTSEQFNHETQEASKETQGLSELVLKLGESRLQSGQFQDSLQLFELLAIRPDSFLEINHHIGLSQMGLGDYQAAQGSFLRQHQQGPSSKNSEQILAALSKSEELWPLLLAQQALTENNKQPWARIAKPALVEIEQMIRGIREKMNAASFDLDIDIESPTTLTPISPSQKFSLKLLIRNKGTHSSPSGQVMFSLVDGQGNEYNIKSLLSFPSIQGKEHSLQEATFILPPSLTPGKYRMTAQLILEGIDAEPGDNYADTASLYLVDLPDPALIRFNLTPTAIDGEFTFRILGKNHGAGIMSQAKVQLVLFDLKNETRKQLLKILDLERLLPFTESKLLQGVIELPDLSDWEEPAIFAELMTQQREKNKKNNRLVSIEGLRGRTKSFTLFAFDSLKSQIFPGGVLPVQLRLINHKNSVLSGLKADFSLVNERNEINLGSHPIELPAKQHDSKRQQLGVPITLKLKIPDLPLGNYELSVLVQHNQEVQKAQAKALEILQFGQEDLRMEQLYVSKTKLIPGDKLQFRWVAKNLGTGPSSAKRWIAELSGRETLSLGVIEIPVLLPQQRREFKMTQFSLPKDIRFGEYELILRPEKRNNTRQELRFGKKLDVQPIVTLEPFSTQRYTTDQPPRFRWKGQGSFQYRIWFTLDQAQTFTPNEALSLPLKGWTPSSELQPDIATWKVLFLLSENGQKPLYWRVEAIDQTGQRQISRPTQIQFR
ncbi:MAG: hypothetical protein COB67_05830, partial [SAR324 cluster bacterium]